MDRFQGHFYNITSKNMEDTIGRHFSHMDHGTIKDLKIHILEFIGLDPDSAQSIKVRDRSELTWIHRLNTVEPRGLNLLD